MKIKRFNEDIDFNQEDVFNPGLKMKRRVIYHVDYSDFNRFVNDTYGGDYNFVADMESSNDTSHEFNVNGIIYDDDVSEDIKSGKYEGWCADTILNTMAADGLIPTGEYIIRVSW